MYIYIERDTLLRYLINYYIDVQKKLYIGELLMNFLSESLYFDVNITQNSRKLWNNVMMSWSVKNCRNQSKSVIMNWKIHTKICNFLEPSLNRLFIAFQLIFGVQSRTKTLYSYTGITVHNTNVQILFCTYFSVCCLLSVLRYDTLD